MNIENPLLRDVLYSLYRAYSSFFSFYPPPKVFVNSVPKAGTHLVRQMLNRVPQFRFYGLHIENRRFLKDLSTAQNPEREPEFDIGHLERSIAAVPDGQYITGHVPYQKPLSNLFDRHHYRIIMVVRDPRDIAVSHAKYVVRLKRHILHERFVKMDDDERLMASISGLRKEKDGVGLLDVGTRFRRFLGWLDRPNTLVCRFEDLIGPKGGGSREAQLHDMSAILKFIDRPVPENRLEEVADKIWSPRSATFRKGQIKDWPNHFKDRHKKVFRKLAGDVLIRMGYERDMTWS